MSRVVPIQTRYAGCHFRSRLEARWAVFFDSLGVPWEYEPEGFQLGEAGAYLPDFLIYPNTETAMWFEVKSRFPTDDEIRKGRALASGTGIRTCIYFASLDVPAPASLAELTFDQYADRRESWHWDNRVGWLPYPDGPAQWEVDLGPTAYMFFPDSADKGRTGHWWWTDCTYCGKVILRFHGQVGYCPSFPNRIPDNFEPYPSFGHATARLQAAYVAARSARFEFGAAGG